MSEVDDRSREVLACCSRITLLLKATAGIYSNRRVMAMRASFMEELTVMNANLVSMAGLVNDTLRDAIVALRDRDLDLARTIINQDDIIDNYLIVIEEEVARLMNAGFPSPMDSRWAMGVLKTAGDLERVGDYATNIAEFVLALKGEEYFKPLISIPQLSSMALSMLQTAVRAFVERDVDLAEAVCKKDDDVDELYHELDIELTAILAKCGDPKVAKQATRFLLLSKDLERVADHATNIGEQAIFVNTGKRVKF